MTDAITHPDWEDCAEIPGWKIKHVPGVGTAIWNGRPGKGAMRHAVMGGGMGLAQLKQWALERGT